MSWLLVIGLLLLLLLAAAAIEAYLKRGRSRPLAASRPKVSDINRCATDLNGGIAPYDIRDDPVGNRQLLDDLEAKQNQQDAKHARQADIASKQRRHQHKQDRIRPWDDAASRGRDKTK